MSVLRVMGTETEYGISVPGQPGANAMVTSSQIVNAYQAATAAKARRARWDFEEENPLRDARGFDLTREAADSSPLTDEDLGLANVILTNGGRLYVDHARPEYSAPECTNPLSVVIWDKAGERVMAEAAAKAATVPGSAPIQLYKNNTDNKGASYGSHENYLMRRGTPFADIVRFLVPFFVSRQVVCGAGRVGLGTDLSVEAPVAELRAISHDPSCRRLLTLKDGRKMTAVQLQAEYLELARKYTEDKYGDDVDDITADVLDRWESVLNRLAEDPMLLSKELDWVAKLELLEGYRTRDGLAWDNPRLQLVDLQYADVRPDRGLYNRLAARGRMVRLTDDATVNRAIENPPEDTRAYFRRRCLRQYPESVAAASWDSVIFDIPGRESLQRVPTLEPLRGTRAHVGELLDRCRTAAELVAALTGQE